MSFLEHLEELRVRLIHSVIALAAAFLFCCIFTTQIFHFLSQPLRKAVPDIKFIYTEPTEGFMLYMKMAFFIGIFLAAPYVLYQVWAFIAPGLYAHEKAYAVPFIVFGSFFFLLGGAFGHFILFPATFQYLGKIGGDEMQFLPRVSDYFDFYSWFVLALGLCFQLPIVIFVLARIGIVTPGFLMRNFKFAFLAAFVISAVITPSGDVVNQTALALPIVALYLLGVLVAWMFGKPRQAPPVTSAE